MKQNFEEEPELFGDSKFEFFVQRLIYRIVYFDYYRYLLNLARVGIAVAVFVIIALLFKESTREWMAFNLFEGLYGIRRILEFISSVIVSVLEILINFILGK